MHPLIARLRQHVVPPHHPNYSQLGFRVHPPTLALCFPSQLCRKCAFHSKTSCTSPLTPRHLCLQAEIARQIAVCLRRPGFTAMGGQGKWWKLAGSRPRTGPDGATFPAGTPDAWRPGRSDRPQTPLKVPPKPLTDARPYCVRRSRVISVPGRGRLYPPSQFVETLDRGLERPCKW